MMQTEFDTQMARLKDTFGDAKFGEERTALIWDAVKHFDASWFRRVVSDFIGDLATAPLASVFRAAAAKERERLRDIDRAKEAKEAKDFWMKSAFPEAEGLTILSAITARLMGKINDQNWNELQENLHDVSRLPRFRPKCWACEDTGFVEWSEDKYSYTGRCRCAAGLGQTDHTGIPLVLPELHARISHENRNRGKRNASTEA